MKIRAGIPSLGLLLGLSLASAAAFGDPTVGLGSFDAGGTIYVSATMVDFGVVSIPPPGDQMAAILLPTTGVFSYLVPGTLFPIRNLNFAAATITATNISFDGTEPDWITLPANTGGGLPVIDLGLTDIPIDTSVPVCTAATPDTPGTSCRPNATSPLTLNQGAGSVTAVLNLYGNAYYVGGAPSSGTPYAGKLSATSTGVDGTITGWLSSFAGTGSFTNAYTANFSTVPEPATLPMLAAGLFAILLIATKKRSAA